MPRKEKKFHFIYKTTCIITNKFYVGMHSTDDLEDGYLGSGKRLKYSIGKYGRKNHKREILEFLPNRKSLKEREENIVNEEFINNLLCMNLVKGGIGGIFNESHHIKMRSGAKKWMTNKMKDEDFKEKLISINKRILADRRKNGEIFGTPWPKGKPHSKETIEKMKLSHKGLQDGVKNSQYGTCWITNEKENKKIYKGDLIPKGWRLGRKM